MPTPQSSSFAARLRELREKANLTQSQLAEHSNLHLSAVTRFEQGLREPSWATAQAHADALGVSCEELRKPPTNQEEPPRPRGRPPKPAAAEPEPPKKPRGRPKKDK